MPREIPAEPGIVVHIYPADASRGSVARLRCLLLENGYALELHAFDDDAPDVRHSEIVYGPGMDMENEAMRLRKLLEAMGRNDVALRKERLANHYYTWRHIGVYLVD